MLTPETLHIILIAVGILAVIALIWMLAELATTLRRTRKTVTSIHQQLDPTLANVKTITDTLQPAVAKVDPLLDRVSLTVDAANLEIMRLDTIMGNLEELSGTLTSTVGAVDTIANAPLNLVNKATAKINGVLGATRAASEDSLALGAQKKPAPAPQLKEPAVPLEEKIAQAAQVARTVREGYVTLVNAGAAAVGVGAGAENGEGAEGAAAASPATASPDAAAVEAATAAEATAAEATPSPAASASPEA